jgi:indole-3-glycerol phosphate synthase
VILSRILEHKKAELRHKQSRGYLSELKKRIQDAPGPLGFAVTLEATRTGASPSLIAEVKKPHPVLGFSVPNSPIGSTISKSPSPIMLMAPLLCLF